MEPSLDQAIQRLSARMGWAEARMITRLVLLNACAVVAAALMRPLLCQPGARPQLGAVDVPGWLGAVSPDRTPPRAPERVREVVLRPQI
jgi:hypothetical protein